MDQSSDAIGKEHVNLAWFDHRDNLTRSESRVLHRLSLSIGSGPVIGRAGLHRGCRILLISAFLEGAALAALRTIDTGDKPFFIDQCDDVTTNLAAFETHLLDPVSDCILLFFQGISLSNQKSCCLIPDN